MMLNCECGTDPYVRAYTASNVPPLLIWFRGFLSDADVEELAAILPEIIKNIVEERRLDRKVENWSL